MEIMRCAGSCVMVRRMPPDGHCLFAALILQFYHSDCDDLKHLQKVVQLRRQVVEHIRANMDTFFEPLVDTVCMLDHLTATDIADRVEEILETLTNVWGSQETIAAAVNILNQRIDVYCEDGDIITFNRSATTYGVLGVAYRTATIRRKRKGQRRANALRQCGTTATTT